MCPTASAICSMSTPESDSTETNVWRCSRGVQLSLMPARPPSVWKWLLTSSGHFCDGAGAVAEDDSQAADIVGCAELQSHGGPAGLILLADGRAVCIVWPAPEFVRGPDALRRAGTVAS